MSATWSDIILDTADPTVAWANIFEKLLETSKSCTSPVALHDLTVPADRLLSEAGWELWAAYPEFASRTSTVLKAWCSESTTNGKAVLILDALSLRELHLILSGAEARTIGISNVAVTGAECPSTTDQFASAIGIPSRASFANDTKPNSFKMISDPLYTDVLSLPFEDCAIPPVSNILIWHTWLDDLIHLQNKLPDQIAANALSTLQGVGFWSFINKLRQGRNLVITSDHGYAVSKLYSSQVADPDAIEVLRQTFGASRYAKVTGPLPKRFMPPLVMTANQQHVITGQWKWKVQGGFPHVCHGGMSLLEVAVPWIELEAIR